MAWAKSRSFLEKIQLGSIVLYLICLGEYTIDAVQLIYDQLRADIFGFTFFPLFIASTILLSLERNRDLGSGTAGSEGSSAEANNSVPGQ